jgi:hypothetical protein
MSLKTDYLNGPNGYYEQMQDVFTQGENWVTSNNGAISAALVANAAKGLRTFTVNLPVAFEPTNLRLLGNHWLSFQAGVVSGLAAQDIYSYECNVELNTDDALTTSIDLNFTF